MVNILILPDDRTILIQGRELKQTGQQPEIITYLWVNQM